MPYQRGEDINIGVGMENPAARGTIVVPQAWIPGRTPTGIAPVVEKVLLKETRATSIESEGSEIVQKRAEGDLEFNIRNNSLGYLLKSLLGKCTTTTLETGVYSHLFEVQTQNPEYPSLSLGLSQPGGQDYQYGLALVNKLELKTPVDDLVNATVSFIAAKEQEKSGSPFSPSFSSNDYYFRHQDVKIKMADSYSELDSAAAMSLKEFSLSIENGSRVNQNIGELNPGNVIALMQSIKATMKADYFENLDQKIGGTGQEYTLKTSVNEGATDKQTFTPTKKYQTKIVFKVTAKGTGDWTILVHNVSNNLVASQVIKNADLTVGYNTAILPWTWTSGSYHVHIISTVADGKVATNVSSDLEGAEMSFYYKTDRDYYTSGLYKALRVEIIRNDKTIGTTNNPKLIINLPKVSFETWSPDRPIDDIVSQSVELTAHYDGSVGVAKAIDVTLVNETANYNHAS